MKKTRANAFVLLTTMILVALLISITAHVANVSSMASIVQKRRHASLTHDLAVDSALLLVADALKGPRRGLLLGELDRLGPVVLDFEIGQAAVTCTLRDDGARFNPRVFQRPDQQLLLTRVLSQLASREGLPPVQMVPRPVVLPTPPPPGAVFHTFDQLLDDTNPGDILRLYNEPDHRVWADALTLWGDGRIDLRRTSLAPLDAALADLQPGLAAAMLTMRPADRSKNFLQAALDRAPAEIRQQVASWVGFDLGRYAIVLETKVGTDRRRWYVIASIQGDKIQVLHRSQVTW